MAQRARPPRPQLVSKLLASEVASGAAVFANQAELAEFLDVHRSQISRLTQGSQQLKDDPAWRLTGLGNIVAALRHLLEPEAIPRWLRGANGHLNFRRPLDLIREGRISEVLAAVEAERAGSFA